MAGENPFIQELERRARVSAAPPVAPGPNPFTDELARRGIGEEDDEQGPEASSRPSLAIPGIPRLSTVVKAIPGAIQDIVKETAQSTKNIMTARSARDVDPGDVLTTGAAFTGAAPGIARNVALKTGQKVAIAAAEAKIAIPRMITSDKPFTRSIGNLLAKAPLIGDKIVLNTERALGQLSNKIDDIKAALGGKSAEEAGLIAQKGLDDAISDSAGVVSLKYKQVEKLVRFLQWTLTQDVN